MLAVVVGFLVVDRLAWNAMRAVRDHSGARFSVMMRGDAQCALLVLGNSRGMNAVLPSRMAERSGLRTFNLSYNGMSTLVAEALLSEYLQRHPPPQLLLLEVSNVRSEHGLLADLKLYLDAFPAVSARLRSERPALAAAATLSCLYRTNGELFLRVAYYRNGSDQGVSNPRAIDMARLQDYLGPDRAISFVDSSRPDNLEALGRIASTCRQHGIRFVPFVGPYLPEYRERVVDWTAWLGLMQEALPSDVRVEDLSTAVTDCGSFADAVHLNAEGSIQLLGPLLKAIGSTE